MEDCLSLQGKERDLAWGLMEARDYLFRLETVAHEAKATDKHYVLSGRGERDADAILRKRKEIAELEERLAQVRSMLSVGLEMPNEELG